MPDIIVNGVATDYISAMDRGLHYGDGIFETILCEDNKLQFWDQHIQRMKQGAEKLKLDFPDEHCFLDDVSALIKHRQYDSAVVKLILTRGAGERGYAAPGRQHPMRITIVHPHIKSDLRQEVAATICQQPVSINSGLAGLKNLNRLENVIARNEWKDELLKTGIRGKGGQRIEFTRVESLGGTRWLQAEAETKEDKPQKVVISFGPVRPYQRLMGFASQNTPYLDWRRSKSHLV